MLKKINVLLIGCGKIGANRFKNNKISHSLAISKNKNLNMIGVIDKNIKNAKKASSYHNHCFYGKSVEEINKIDKQIDLAVVSTPTETHYKIINYLLKTKVNYIFSEKPFCIDYTSIQKIINLNHSKKKIVVNYSRRWDRKIAQITNDIKNEKWGKIFSVHGLFNGSFINIGTHMLDLFYMIFNDYKFIEKTKFFNSTIYSFKSKKTIIHLNELKKGDYPIFDLTMFCEKGSIRFFDNSKFIGIKNVINSSIHYGEKMFSSEKIIKTNYMDLLDFSYQNIFENFKKNVKIKSTHENALLVHKMINDINS